MEWDEPDEEYRASGPEEPAFAEESVQRELALVALEAAALSRRIFPPPLTRRALSEEARQALLALALVDPGEGLSPRTLGAVLALDAEDARQGIAELPRSAW